MDDQLHGSTTSGTQVAGRVARGLAVRVPEITVYFWILKSWSTALGESTSDFLVHLVNPVVAVSIGFVGLVVALLVQFSMRRYAAWAYWFAVVMVGIFGTMAADVLHVGFHVPYAASTVLAAAALAAVFITWQRSEHTLSVHSIDTARREAFYWAAVVSTFALGTAVGDLTAISLHLGYFGSVLLFATLILIPAIGYAWCNVDPIIAFWSAYVLTRPLGASVADWLGKPTSSGGLGWGNGWVSLTLALMILVVVGFLAATHADVQPDATVDSAIAFDDETRGLAGRG
jgi:uncharacterized membrane-anchored protein